MKTIKIMFTKTNWMLGIVTAFAISLCVIPLRQSVAQGIFNLVKTVAVTPSGDYLNADFVRIGYVPGKNRFIVTFNTMVSDSGWCPESYDLVLGLYRVYACKEYTADMDETGKDSVISCHGTSDTGGFLIGDDFYLASAEPHGTVDGWNLAKFNAVTWADLTEYYYPLTDSSWQAADPTVALVNGQIDISAGKGGSGTHHHFFTTALQFVNQKVLSDTDHIGFSSMITLGGITYFLSSKPGLPFSVIVMKYDTNWTYLGMKTLRENAATPQGLAFDGTRFYVAYTARAEGLPFVENVHLAAFDTNWSLVDDIALTNFTQQDQTSSIHPFLAMRNNRLYVSYSQNTPAGGIVTLQAYVKIYAITTGIQDFSYPDEVRIFPNPFSTQTILQTDKIFKDATLTIYNSFGQQVKQIKNVSGRTITLFRENLPSGLYILRLTQDNKIIPVDKLVITD
jgi:hypothetical protein